MTEYVGPSEEELRIRATKRVKARRDFKGHLLAYLSVNAFLLGVWYMTSGGFFWPGIVMLGWGIGVVMNAWDVYTPDAREEQIAKEMERLRR
jgi:hypothetical protein